MAIDVASLYDSTLRTTAAAHDRLLQATAQQIGDLLRVERDVLSVSVPLAMIEALEGAGGSRVFYRVIGFDGRHVAGDAELPPPPATAASAPRELRQSFRADVDGKPVQVTALYQPIETSQGQGVALVLVGETLEARQASAATLLQSMLVRQAVLMLVIAATIWAVVRQALRPLAALGNELKQRSAEATSALTTHGPEELEPVIDEMNALFLRQRQMLLQQQRLIADASHQLRTPMTVLKTQLQSAMGGDAPVEVVLPEMLRTVDRTTHLANQLLNKVRLETMRSAEQAQPLDMNQIAQEAVIEMSPLLAAKHIDCSLDTGSAVIVRGNGWMAGELVRNLLSNAIRHTPAGGALGIRLRHDAAQGAELTVWDSGPGISEDMRAWLFQPFAAAHGIGGSGLGLSICLEIAQSMQARIELVNRVAADGAVQGLDARVQWPE
nr:sensor histidine kinase N-terminal domain-containing protein [Aquabacterium terrae]